MHVKSDGKGNAGRPRPCSADGCVEPVGRPRLSRWAEVADRLLIRVVPAADGGPLARPLGYRLALDVGINIGADPGTRGRGEAVPTVGQVGGWGRSRPDVWARARSNSRARSSGATIRRSGAQPLILVTGDQWLTGILLDLDRLLPPRQSAVGSAQPRFVSVLGPTAVLVIDPPRRNRSAAEPVRSGRRRAELIVADWFASGRATYPQNLFTITDRPDRLGGEAGG